MCDKGKEWSQKTIPDGHNMTIVRPTFFGCRLLFTTRNFVFGMNNVVAEYQISSSEPKDLIPIVVPTHQIMQQLE